jgi:hypothetical protein
MRGYPIGTVIFYGPDDRRATKGAAGVRVTDNVEPAMRPWLVEARDARNEPGIMGQVVEYSEANGVLSVALVDRICGGPHQEGIDYEGDYCPVCAFWIGRDRFTGKKLPPT